ncbi:hypothetical protein HP15_887 [Marinobacter adhaerens HP15]|uniref:Uncharacterized protein n=1 Tax=Marinobacter adhaerens (strain DSM 23420 / HP15) TaxID=225937 RepID=E4PEU6_MARAH|nr:hypothetical protein HP15_887 [Marinobacter adhaerens HP15]
MTGIISVWNPGRSRGGSFRASLPFFAPILKTNKP